MRYDDATRGISLALPSSSLQFNNSWNVHLFALGKAILRRVSVLYSVQFASKCSKLRSGSKHELYYNCKSLVLFQSAFSS